MLNNFDFLLADTLILNEEMSIVLIVILLNYLSRIPKKEKDNVKFVCIDMYMPYKDICQTYFKKARIYVDSFHVIQHLNTSFNNIRIRVMKMYITDSKEYYLLKNWKEEIINSFSKYKGRRLNNGIAESINSKIRTILYVSKGIKNSKRRRYRIIHSINK